jgi:pectin methylesterase-like acyl-CoA thioesterase
MEHSGAKLKSLISSLLFFFSIFVIIDVSVNLIDNASGDTFYVNTTGDGGAFTSIQDAINASSDGDTVFVYNGTFYENVVVNRTISLVGEGKNHTIIDGGGN